MCCKLHLLVPPLRGPVVAGDQTHPVHTAEIAVDERVARFGLLVRALGKAEMPRGVLLPGVGFQERVLFPCTRLPVLPARAEHELPRVDQLLRMPDRRRVRSGLCRCRCEPQRRSTGYRRGSIPGCSFPGVRGGPLNLHEWRADEWTPAVRAAGLEHRSPYALRHTYATFGIAAGVSLFELARFMGTSVEQIDKTYGHLLPDALDRTRTALDAFVASEPRLQRNRL